MKHLLAWMGKRLVAVFLTVIFFMIAIFGIVYASGLFSALPANPTPIAFSGSFANIFQMCNGNDFVKGFDKDYNQICVPYNSPMRSTFIPD